MAKVSTKHVFSLLSLAAIVGLLVYLNDCRVNAKSTTIKYILQDTLIRVRSDLEDDIENLNQAWKIRLSRAAWERFYEAPFPRDPYETKSYLTVNDTLRAHVFPVKYASLEGVNRNDRNIPVMIYVDDSTIPGFSDVKFTPYDIRECVRQGISVTAINSDKRVWRLSKEECDYIVRSDEQMADSNVQTVD